MEGRDIVGRRVLVVEDTTTIGGSPLPAVEAMRETGATPVGVYAPPFADRDAGAAAKIEAAGVPYRSSFSLQDPPAPSANGSVC